MKTLKLQVFALLLGILGLLQSTAASAEVTTNISVPFNVTIFIPCANSGAGELVQLSGDLHVLLLATVSTSARVIIKFHFQPQGISGVGETTGDIYHGTGVTQATTTFDGIVGFPFETSFVNNFRIIGQKPGNNFLVHENFQPECASLLRWSNLGHGEAILRDPRR